MIQKLNFDARLWIGPFRDPLLPLHFAGKDEDHRVVGNRDKLVDVVLQNALKFGQFFALDADARRLAPFPNIFLLFAPILFDERDPDQIPKNFVVRQRIGDSKPFFQSVRHEQQGADCDGNE